MLSDSIIEFDGVYTHNFQSRQSLQPGTDYRLTVECPGGRSTQATATMSETDGLALIPKDSIGCLSKLSLRLPGLPANNPEQFVRASAAVNWRDTLRWRDLNRFQLGRPSRIGPMSLIERAVPDSLLPRCRQDYCSGLDIDSIEVAFTHFGLDWPADSVRGDPTASTVQNGLGVFVGIHHDTLAREIGGTIDPPTCL